MKVKLPKSSSFPKELLPKGDIESIYGPLFIPKVIDEWRKSLGFNENYYQVKLWEAILRDVFEFSPEREDLQALLMTLASSYPYRRVKKGYRLF